MQSITSRLLEMFDASPVVDEPYEEPAPVARPKLEEFPEDVAACQKLNLSGLTENSNGNGMKRNTVYHAIALNPIDKGRLKRNRYDFLCGASKQRSFGYAGRAASDVSCPKCKAAIDRYGLSVCRDARIDDLISCYQGGYMNWISCETPPEFSGRYLVEMEEFGVRGRHFSTATYWINEKWWDIDHHEMREMTPMNWMEIEDKVTPLR